MSGQKKDRPVSELFSELGETLVDHVAPVGDAVADVPVVGWAFKVVKALDDIRSHLLARKIAKFLCEPSLIAAAEARQMRGKIDDDEYAQQVGETLLMVLDKITDMSKPTLLAKAYATYLDERISKDALLRLAHAIDVSSILDLHQFVQADADDTGWRERLLSSGLFQLYLTNAISDTSRVELAPLGRVFELVLAHTSARQEA